MSLPEREAIPRRIGRYEVLHPIARGGMAEVFLCRASDGPQRPLVAVKRIYPYLAEEEDFVKMFIDEARIAATLDHPAIAQIHEFGIEFGRGGAHNTYFIVMEHVAGMDVRAIQKDLQTRKLCAPPAMAAWIVAQVCTALEAAHLTRSPQGTPLGIIHRDVSPSNVLVSFDGQIKLIDFGVAKAAQRLHQTQARGLKGKFAYMSPEQASGEPVDHRSDIFSAGTLLCELLTGTNPFRGDGDLETLKRVQQARITPPALAVAGIQPELEAVCIRALARQPGERYPDAGHMRAVLEAFCTRAGYGRTQLAAWMGERFATDAEKIARAKLALAVVDAGSTDEPAAPRCTDAPEPTEAPTSVERPGSSGGATGLQHSVGSPRRRPRSVALALVGAGLLVATGVVGATIALVRVRQSAPSEVSPRPAASHAPRVADAAGADAAVATAKVEEPPPPGRVEASRASVPGSPPSPGHPRAGRGAASAVRQPPVQGAAAHRRRAATSTPPTRASGKAAGVEAGTKPGPRSETVGF